MKTTSANEVKSEAMTNGPSFPTNPAKAIHGSRGHYCVMHMPVGRQRDVIGTCMIGLY